MDLSATATPMLKYINKGLHKTYMSINEVIDGILSFVCTINPHDDLNTFLRVMEAQLIEYDYEPFEVIEVVEYIEIIGMLIIKEFESAGFYQLDKFWGYKLSMWLSPTTVLLSFGLPFELEQRINMTLGAALDISNI